MKIYHYTHENYWPSIKGGLHEGLQANHRMGVEYQQARDTPASRGLLAPLPASWTNNPILGDMMSLLRNDIGNILIEIDTKGYPGKIFVADRTHMQVFLNEIQGVPSQYIHGTREDAEKAYVDSLVDINEYTVKGYIGYNLPEVIIPDTVPPNYLAISKMQPLLKEELDRINRSEGLEQEIRRIKYNVPELGVWFDQYLKRNSLYESVGFIS